MVESMPVVLSGNPRPESRTLRLAKAVGTEISDKLGRSAPSVIDVAAFGTRLLAPDDEVNGAVAALREADVLVVATPTYKGTYTGVLKVLLDYLPSQGLAGVVAVTVTTAGIEPQALATTRYLRELLTELGATVVEPGLSVVESQLVDIPSVVADYLAGLSPEAFVAWSPE
jgi:FMN reductase